MTALVLALLGAASPVEACIRASDEAQQLRDERKWQLAAKQLLACAADSCPKVVRTNCLKWRAELDEKMPTVLVSAQADGADALDAAVTIDGAAITLSGTALPLDPGSHAFEATLGERTVATKVLILEGEKNRKLVLTLPPAPAPPISEPVVVAPRPPPVVIAPVPATPSRPFPLGPVVLGVVSAGSWAAFAGLGLDGRAKQRSLEAAPCAFTRSCESASVSALKQQYVVADVMLVVASVALAAAIAWGLAWAL